MLFIHFVRYGPRLAYLLTVASLLALPGRAQNQPVRVIAFGAHPDDCDLGAGGIAAKYAARGDKVKFVSLTNGDVGHQSQHVNGCRGLRENWTRCRRIPQSERSG